MHYFIDTYGSKGRVTFDMPYKVKRLYGYPQKTMRDIVEGLSEKAKDRNIRTEFIHCFLNNSVKGIAFPELGWCIMNTLPYEETGLVNSLFGGYADALRELKNATQHFSAALKIHDEWEKYYIENLDFAYIDELSTQMREEILGEKAGDEQGMVVDRFLGAATASGAVDYIENLTENIKTRYFIKGRPGTGKSTFLKKMIDDASRRGFDVERYHCSFDPKSLDMLIVRSLDLCIFDSTAPHEHFPEREGDVIIDFYEAASKRNVDREFKEELAKCAAQYKEKINMAVGCIAKSNSILAQGEKVFEASIDKKNTLCLIEVLAAEVFG